jgi:hypothetical protein
MPARLVTRVDDFVRGHAQPIRQTSALERTLRMILIDGHRRTNWRMILHARVSKGTLTFVRRAEEVSIQGIGLPPFQYSIRKLVVAGFWVHLSTCDQSHFHGAVVRVTLHSA